MTLYRSTHLLLCTQSSSRPKMLQVLLFSVLVALSLVRVQAEEESEWTQCTAECMCTMTSDNSTAAYCTTPVLDGQCDENFDVPKDVAVL